MFRLSESRATNRGVYCGEDGLYLGPVALIEGDDEGYRARPSAEIEALLAAAYETPPEPSRCLRALRGILDSLRAGNLSLAQIGTLQLRLAEVADDRIEALIRTDALLKANFNPAQPRDALGRWTDDEGDANEGGGAHSALTGEGTGSSSTEQVPTSAGGSGPAVSRTWENYPNADFRNRLAEAEGSVKPNDPGYGAVLDRTDRSGRHIVAFGRYQMTPAALQASGVMDRAGNWTGKYGIHSRADFLRDPDAQEKALSDYLADLDRQLRADGAYPHIGEMIDGLKARFRVTRAGILAAAHREGAEATADYLKRVKAHGLTSRGLRLKPQDRPIETRLRTFSEATYD